MQKRTKRDENKIITWFIFYLLLSSIFAWVLSFHLIPWVFWEDWIEKQKQELKILDEEYNLAKTKWIPKNKFLSKSWALAKDEYTKNILKELRKDEEFFSRNFENNTSDDYKIFLKKKLEEYKKDDSNEEKLKIISKVLPYYSENLPDFTSISDFQFINYIESIIYTFWLSYTNSIWIKELNQIENFLLTDSDNSLDKWIFEIPIELDLTWRKSSILDFLHFIENVWKISINEETNEININFEKAENWEIFSEFRNKRLNYLEKENTNIYNNQIIDIENIFMEKYIDSGIQVSNFETNGEDKKFLKYLKATQSRESFSIKVNLKFYVKWAPKYKIEEFKANFIKKLDNLSKQVKDELKKTNISSYQRQKLSSLDKNLENIKNVVKNTNSSTQIWIMEDYKNIVRYSSLLDEYENEINNIKK